MLLFHCAQLLKVLEKFHFGENCNKVLIFSGNALVALYAGVQVPTNQDYPLTIPLEERENLQKNLIGYSEDLNLQLDIPPHLDGIVAYRASLGHKVMALQELLIIYCPSSSEISSCVRTI